MTDKKIDSLKHKKAKRALIPSKEEAGTESNEPSRATLPLNPVTTRGQDPELYWLDKYGEDDNDDLLDLDIRSLYRAEHIPPEKLIQRLYKFSIGPQGDLFGEDAFAAYKDIDELDKPDRYYKHSDDWSNRLIQGDSLMVMASLLEREGMAGLVQTIYIDPPYGIKYNSNWQMRMNDRNVKDGDDASLSGEPEVIKAFRDTWELGIHSYLSYLRDRLLVAKELLTESGSCFVQISDENVHLVRCVMDEVFGSENFVSLVTFKKTGGQTSTLLAPVSDYIIWYAKNADRVKDKYHQLYHEMRPGEGHSTGERYDQALLPDGSTVTAGSLDTYPDGTRFFRHVTLSSNRPAKEHEKIPYEFNGRSFYPPANRTWTTTKSGFERLVTAGRVHAGKQSLNYIKFIDDFPANPIGNLWDDVSGSGDKVYVVQTSQKVIERCILMTTDPGDLVLDPTCGSGTTAYVAEQWGRRWITTDTSRVALNIAKTRLMTASFPWYVLTDEKNNLDPKQWDVRHGFDYKTVQRVTLGSLANDEPPETVTLYDQPVADKKKLRVAGPFTVETLQSYEPLAPEALAEASLDAERLERFQARVFEHLKSAGVKNGDKQQMAVFTRIDVLPDSDLHAEGYYDTAAGEQKAYIHLGPQFAPISKQAVSATIKACRRRGDAQWLLILGFAFESDVENSSQNQKAGSFEVTKVRMHDDLLQAGLKKKDPKAASFVTIGEPDIVVVPCTPPHPSPLSLAGEGALPASGGGAGGEGKSVVVEIRGLDIYDPVKDEVKPRSVADIAYWMVDDDYDGASFMVRQVFFCGGDKDEFDKWKKGLSELAKQKTRKKVEMTLKIEIDEDAFDRLYGFRSHPIPLAKGKKVAVRVVSQFGEESTKVLTL